MHLLQDDGRVNTRAISLVVLLAIGAIVLSFFLQHKKASLRSLSTISGTYLIKPLTVKHFSLTDNKGFAFTNADLKKHWTFLFFGYTECKQLCSKTMRELSQVATTLKKSSQIEQPRFVMVSVDPNRDTISRLDQYVGSFNKSFLGLRGSKQQTEILLKQIRAIVGARRTGSFNASYQVSHSEAVVLIDKRGRVRAVFNMPQGATQLAQDYIKISSH